MKTMRIFYSHQPHILDRKDRDQRAFEGRNSQPASRLLRQGEKVASASANAAGEPKSLLLHDNIFQLLMGWGHVCYQRG